MIKPSITGCTFAGTCKCSGTLNLKYKTGDYIIYLLPKRKVFHLKLINNYLHKNQPIDQLCQQLKALGLTDSDDCFVANPS